MAFLLGQDFINHLVNIGAIPDGGYQKVVIEAECAEVVRVYTLSFGSPSLVRVDLAPHLQVQVLDVP